MRYGPIAIILLTGNRNEQGNTSLGTTIRNRGTPTSLPVFTLSDPARLMLERSYAERVAESMLEHLIDIDKHRGSGRIWLP